MRRIRQAFLLLTVSLAAAAHALCPQSSEQFEFLGGTTPVVRGRVILRPANVVRFRKFGPRIIQSLFSIRIPLPIREIGGGGAFVVDVPAISTRTLLSRLNDAPWIDSAEPDYIVREMDVLPDDDYVDSQWALARIGAPAAWAATKGSRTIVVAVSDSGLALTHPDLAGNLWSAPANFSVKVGNRTVPCPAGAAGYDALKRTCIPEAATGHGTHVAGIIGAVGNNKSFIAGINWEVRLMPLRFIGAGGTGCVSDAIDGLEFARQALAGYGAAANVRVVNMSWGLDAEPIELRNELARVRAANILPVAAAGNDGRDIDSPPRFYPASFVDDVLSVTATNPQDALIPSISNFGRNTVGIGAPGEDILSTWHLPPYFNLRSGTSMAAPQVAGAAALLMSLCTLTADQARQILMDSVDQTAELRTKTISGGRLNIKRAIDQCLARSVLLKQTTVLSKKRKP
jgi:thermitase